MFTRFIGFLLVVLALLAIVAPAMAGETTTASGGGKEEINPIPMSWEQFKGDVAIWTAVVFLLVLAVLWKFAWGPLASGLDKRERHIADQIAQANNANQQAKQLLANYEKKLGDSQQEVRNILEKGRRDAELLGHEMIDKAKADAKVEGERMLKQIDAATTTAIKELADRSAALAVELAGKIVRAELKAKDHAQLIEQAVNNFAESKGGAESVSRN